MGDANFVILNIQILIRSNFSEVSQGRNCIAHFTKRVFFWFCHKVWKGKMGLFEKLVTAMNEELPTNSDNKEF